MNGVPGHLELTPSHGVGALKLRAMQHICMLPGLKREISNPAQAERGQLYLWYRQERAEERAEERTGLPGKLLIIHWGG
jgi:hypothetical protein